MKNSSEETRHLGYKIVKIHTTKFAYQDIDEESIHNIFNNEDTLKANLSVNMSISLNKSEIVFEIHTSLINKFTEDIVIEHLGKTTFLVRNLEEYYNRDEDNYHLPDDFVVQLYALSYSHARVLLSEELSRTALKDKFYLPVIDPRNILKK